MIHKAMLFALHAHRHQLRRYTGDLYFTHLAQVVGIVSGTIKGDEEVGRNVILATAWLHDVVEDTDTTVEELRASFGEDVASGVLLLSDMESGNRATRKAATCMRLHIAPSWIQNIKVANLSSNALSIRQHDPKFFAIFASEGIALLDVLNNTDRESVTFARSLLN